jgi:hypothetical protein
MKEAEVVLQKYPSLAEAVNAVVFIDPVCQLTAPCNPVIVPVVLLIVPLPEIPAVVKVPELVIVPEFVRLLIVKFPALFIFAPDETVTVSPLSVIVVVVPFLGLILLVLISLIAIEIYIE